MYDNSGNLKQDLNKGISSIVYNHLNKPTLITFSNGKKIQYIYDASGAKLRQKVFGNGGSSTTVETDYVGPFHYEDNDGDGSSATTAIQFFAHEEGRVRRAGSDLIYETFLKDHLGNVRVMFADMNGDGAVSPDPVNGEVLQVDHYYPFGLRMAGLSLVPAVKNSYLFTGKEAQDELGLGWIDFGARMYDAAASRWNGVDGMAEKYLPISPFVYVANNPLLFVDPNGKEIIITLYEKVVGDDGEETTQVNNLTYNGRELLDEDGNVYEGDNQFALDALQALNHLKEKGASKVNFGEEGDEPVDILDAFIGNDKPNVTIELSSKGGAHNGGIGLIEWAPRLGSQSLQKDRSEYFIPDEGDYIYSSPTAILGHEFIHAYNEAYDLAAKQRRLSETDDRSVFPFFPNAEEKETTLNWGNQIIKALGEDLRTNYRGSKYETVSPVSTKAVE
ncbi:MAG: RHS repeat-associated core domain-containing protein [Bacteroidia bacterium]|nr:RHS repeat-associated core domain-containing protein [Bacteroidia bacterium]